MALRGKGFRISKGGMVLRLGSKMFEFSTWGIYQLASGSTLVLKYT